MSNDLLFSQRQLPLVIAERDKLLAETAQQAARIAELEELLKRTSMAVKAACIGSNTPPSAAAVLMSEQGHHLADMENRQLREHIAQLTERLATSEKLRRDEESWWKEKHDYQSRAETAESQLATAQKSWKQVANALGWSEYERLGKIVWYDPEGGHLSWHELPATLAPRITELRTELATALAQLKEAESNKGTEAIWNALQEIAPWAESNDMDWADEILCGITGVKEALAAKTRELEEIAKLLPKWASKIRLFKTLYNTVADNPEEMVNRSNWLGRISSLETAHEELSALIAARSAPPAEQKHYDQC